MNPTHKRAQDTLREMLVGLLGQGLPGVSGFGLHWSSKENGPALGVFLDKHATAELVEHSLPPTIEDIPIEVGRRGSAKFDG